MKDNREKDKELLDNLDALLAGRKNQIVRPLDDDNKSALELASKMVALREKPSIEFTTNLKAELIHRIAEQDKKENSKNQGFPLWEPRSKLWQGTIGALIALIIAAIIFLIIFLLNRGA